MNFQSRYIDEHGKVKVFGVIRDVALFIVILLILLAVWPLRSVPTGYRGVITVGGSIKGIQGEGFALLWPWESLDNFSIRAESADIKDADGATSDTQPVTTSLTVRYSIVPDKVAHVFEQYSHNGNLNSYIQTASLETFKAVTARYGKLPQSIYAGAPIPFLNLSGAASK